MNIKFPETKTKGKILEIPLFCILISGYEHFDYFENEETDATKFSDPSQMSEFIQKVRKNSKFCLKFKSRLQICHNLI